MTNPYNKPASCLGCPYYERRGPVWGHGSPNAKLVTIAQNPWESEWESGIPLSGSSGAVYNRACGSAGIDRAREFTTNIVKCLVAPGERLDPRAVVQCRPLLHKELSALNRAETILTLGQEAFNELTGKDLAIYSTRGRPGARGGLNNNPRGWLRGCPIDTQIAERPFTVIPTSHPSYIMRTGFRDSPIFEADFRKAKRIAEGGRVRVSEQLNYSPTDAEVIDVVQEIIHRGEAGLDIETDEKGGEETEDDLGIVRPDVHITVVGLAPTIHRAVGVAPRQFHLLTPLWDAPGLTLYGFNNGYDFGHLANYFAKPDISSLLGRTEQFDGMLALNDLYSDVRPKDLATFMSLFTDAIYSKNLYRTDPDRYNFYDCVGALWGGRNAREAMRDIGCLKVFREHDMPCIDVVEDLQRHGPKCDVDLAMQMELQCMMALGEYEKFWTANFPTILWSSPKQLIEFFTQVQGLPVQMRERIDKTTKQRKKTPTADDEALELYRDKYKSQLAGLILEMRKLKKASDFTRYYDPDGYAHSRYKIHGQVAGRIQSSNPDLQNIPEKIAGITPRKIVRADTDEHVIINADFAQIELMIYAWYAQDRPILEAKERGDYIYGIFWEEWFPEKPPFFVQGKPKTKQNINPAIEPADILFIKTAPLGLIYGRQADSLTKMGLSSLQANGKFKKFHSDHHAIGEFHRKVMRDVEQRGYAQNVFGRIRRFPNPKGMRPEILSFYGQNTGSDVLKSRALIPLKRDLPSLGGRLIYTVHDSVGVCARKDRLADTIALVKSSMEAPIPEMNGFFISADVKVGPNWYDIMSYEKYVAKYGT